MSAESNARMQIGLLLRKFREQKGWKRPRLEEEAGLKSGVIKRLEHGVVNPARREFLRVIRILELPAREHDQANRLLKVIFPYKRRKVDWHCHVRFLKHPNRCRR